MTRSKSTKKTKKEEILKTEPGSENIKINGEFDTTVEPGHGEPENPAEVKPDKKPVEENKAEESPVSAEDILKAAKKLEEAQENFKKFTVHTNGNFIKMKAYRTAIPMYQLPEDLRKYLLRKGFGTNVWEKDQEWLDKHHADPEMIEKLKQFISKNYL